MLYFRVEPRAQNDKENKHTGHCTTLTQLADGSIDQTHSVVQVAICSMKFRLAWNQSEPACLYFKMYICSQLVVGGKNVLVKRQALSLFLFLLLLLLSLSPVVSLPPEIWPQSGQPPILRQQAD